MIGGDFWIGYVTAVFLVVSLIIGLVFLLKLNFLISIKTKGILLFRLLTTVNIYGTTTKDLETFPKENS